MSWTGYIVIKGVGKMCLIKLFLVELHIQKGVKAWKKPSTSGDLLFAYPSVRQVGVKP